ncbi:hypothetical protein PPYR_15020, partial [Photinus pyralis]
ALHLQVDHSKKCTGGQLEPILEERNGLVSTITFKCNYCGFEIKRCTHPGRNYAVQNINTAAVWSTISAGNTFSNLQERLAIMNIPPLTYSMFQKIECFLSKEWEDRLWISIEKAGIEEYDIAISKGQVDENGLAWVVVYTDCGWSQRSYGHSYNASSGVAVIIGKATGKILFLGVRNKYCSVCARAKKEDEIKEHICYKNWTASSGAMESDIIVEGFNHSISMHKIKYLKFIAAYFLPQ